MQQSFHYILNDVIAGRGAISVRGRAVWIERWWQWSDSWSLLWHRHNWPQHGKKVRYRRCIMFLHYNILYTNHCCWLKNPNRVVLVNLFCYTFSCQLDLITLNLCLVLSIVNIAYWGSKSTVFGILVVFVMQDWQISEPRESVLFYHADFWEVLILMVSFI